MKWTNAAITEALKEAQFGDSFAGLTYVAAYRFRKIGTAHGQQIELRRTGTYFENNVFEITVVGRLEAGVTDADIVREEAGL